MPFSNLRIIIATAFAISPVCASAQDTNPAITGEMACEVIHNTVVDIEDGKTTTYTGYKDFFEVGDTLNFSYEVTPRLSDFAMYLKDDAREQTIIAAYTRSEDIRPFTDRNVVSFGSDLFGGGSFGLDYVRFNNALTDVRLTRYYRSDWQGIAVSFSENDAHTFTMDCRTTGADNIQLAFETIQSMLDTAKSQ